MRSAMKKAKLIAALLALFVTLPIWFYLMHWVLKASNAGELQMFLFWVYVPVTIAVTALAKLAEE
jgi:hypothetical protein